MRIDRQRFLHLAAAIAAATVAATACGCGQTPAPEEPRASTPIDIPPQPLRSPSETAQASAPPPKPDVSALAPVTERASTPVADSATVAAASPSGPPDPYKGTPVSAKACDPKLNNLGAAGMCSLKAPGPTCESFGDTKQECPTLTRLLKPRVAEAAIACLNRRSGTREICEFNVTSICAYEALASGCLDPAARPICNKVVAHCGPPRGHYNKMTQESCEAGVSGIADGKRARFISCITESCRFETCLTYL